MTHAPDDARGEVAEALPALVRQALARYTEFARSFDDKDANDKEKHDKEKEAKAFAAYQSACKAAVGHLDALFRLQRLAEPQKGEAGGGADSRGRRENPLNDLVREARTAVGHMEDEP
ncbi:hypothetical protein [Ferruginivarius sediminum]|uniref:Uncharacterized protein n=1 Tax=Ferruginivarius sediminum TaxID=2661937 RepID=A0A369T759_9PROT|nr:hypothetical protein [Ferruginivarius sediminum]RDD60195.1 hypothetical protein DRB17_19275 [Ferruginivarius sediminum]